MAVLPENTYADIERLFLDEAVVIGASKPKQAVKTRDTNRWVVVSEDGLSIVFGVSDDSKQVLLEGPQNIPGAKTFDGGAVINSAFSVNVRARMNSAQFSKQRTETNGGANEGAAPNVAFTDEAEIIFNPATTSVSFFNIPVPATVGTWVLLKNNSATVNVTIGLGTNFVDGQPLVIAPKKSIVVRGDGTLWWPEVGSEVVAASLSPNLAVFTNASGDFVSNPISGSGSVLMSSSGVAEDLTVNNSLTVNDVSTFNDDITVANSDIFLSDSQGIGTTGQGVLMRFVNTDIEVPLVIRAGAITGFSLGNLNLSGGSPVGDGGHISLYSDDHASLDNHIEMYTSSILRAYWDDIGDLYQNGDFHIQGNDVVFNEGSIRGTTGLYLFSTANNIILDPSGILEVQGDSDFQGDISLGANSIGGAGLGLSFDGEIAEFSSGLHNDFGWGTVYTGLGDDVLWWNVNNTTTSAFISNAGTGTGLRVLANSGNILILEDTNQNVQFAVNNVGGVSLLGNISENGTNGLSFENQDPTFLSSNPLTVTFESNGFVYFDYRSDADNSGGSGDIAHRYFTDNLALAEHIVGYDTSEGRFSHDIGTSGSTLGNDPVYHIDDVTGLFTFEKEAYFNNEVTFTQDININSSDIWLGGDLFINAGDVTFIQDVDVEGSLNANGPLNIGDETVYQSSAILDVGNGYVDAATAHANRIDISGYSLIVLSPASGNNYYGFTGWTQGQHVEVLTAPACVSTVARILWPASTAVQKEIEQYARKTSFIYYNSYQCWDQDINYPPP